MAAHKNRFLQVVKYILLFALAILLVYLAFRTVDWDVFLAGLRQTRWVWVILFLVASVVALFGRAIRWRELLRPFDDSIEFGKVWDANNIGNLASAALPGTGEFLRCGYISSKKIEFDKALGTMLCERLWDFIAILVLTVATFLLQWDRFGDYFKDNILAPFTSAGAVWIMAGIVVAATIFILVVFRLKDRSKFCRRVAESISRLWAGITAFNKSKNKLLVALTTLLIWFTYVVMCFCIIKAMPALEGLDLADAAFLSLVGNIASVVPVPGGVGAYHYLVAAALGLYGHSWDTGILFATLNHEIHALLIIVLGIVSYINLVRKPLAKKHDAN